MVPWWSDADKCYGLVNSVVARRMQMVFDTAGSFPQGSLGSHQDSVAAVFADKVPAVAAELHDSMSDWGILVDCSTVDSIVVADSDCQIFDSDRPDGHCKSSMDSLDCMLDYMLDCSWDCNCHCCCSPTDVS